MPEISRFLGIVIKMYFKDHNPPHFHVFYNEFSASIDITDCRIINGNLPPRIYSLVAEWSILNKKNLLENWKKMENNKDPMTIKPLV